MQNKVHRNPDSILHILKHLHWGFHPKSIEFDGSLSTDCSGLWIRTRVHTIPSAVLDPRSFSCLVSFCSDTQFSFFCSVFHHFPHFNATRVRWLRQLPHCYCTVVPVAGQQLKVSIISMPPAVPGAQLLYYTSAPSLLNCLIIPFAVSIFNILDWFSNFHQCFGKLVQ